MEKKELKNSIVLRKWYEGDQEAIDAPKNAKYKSGLASKSSTTIVKEIQKISNRMSSTIGPIVMSKIKTETLSLYN